MGPSCDKIFTCIGQCTRCEFLSRSGVHTGFFKLFQFFLTGHYLIKLYGFQPIRLGCLLSSKRNRLEDVDDVTVTHSIKIKIWICLLLRRYWLSSQDLSGPPNNEFSKQRKILKHFGFSNSDNSMTFSSAS